MKLDLIRDFLELNGVGTAGRDLFVNNMPAKATLGIILRQPFGGTPINYELPGYAKSEFMLIVRAREYSEGWDLMQAAMTALTVHNSDAITGYRVNYMRPRHEPISFPPSPGNQTEFLVNVDTCYVALPP